jgi:hypothetical protein
VSRTELLLTAGTPRLLPTGQFGFSTVGITVGQQYREPVHWSVNVAQLDKVARLPARRYRPLRKADLPNTSIIESYEATTVGDFGDGEPEWKRYPVAVPAAARNGGMALSHSGAGGDQGERGDKSRNQAKRFHGDTLDGL